MSSGVEFDEDALKYAPRRAAGGSPGLSNASPGGGYVPGGSTEPKMVQWMIRKGIVTSPRMAQGILFGLVVVNLIITYIVIVYYL